MRCSLYLSPRSRRPSDQLPLIRLLLEQAAQADAAGFEAIVLTEHHLSSHNPYQNSLLFAASIAQRIERAHIILATINPAIHQPLRLVESCNLLDQLLGGRFIIGFGPGFVDDEYRAFGRDPAERVKLFETSLQVALDLWGFADGAAPFDYVAGGERGRIDRPVVPAPFRSPHPLFARATLTDATIVDTARKGWPVFVGKWDAPETARRLAPYHDALARSGHDPEVVATARRWTGTMKWIHVAETDAEARSHVEASIGRWLGAPHGDQPAGTPGRASGDDHAVPETASSDRSGAKGDPASLRSSQIICGSPATVAAELERYAAAGVGQMMCNFVRDLDEADAVRRSFALFCSDVLPLFASDPEPALAI